MPAPLFRLVERDEPTLLLDEADTYFRDAQELRGFINRSHRRDLAFVARCVGDYHEPRKFSTWCILERLNEMDHRPWPEWTRGHPLAAHGLAKLLKPFRIVSGTIRAEGIDTADGTAKGYKRGAFARVWERYSIGDTPDPSVTKSQSALDKEFGDPSSVTNSESVTDTQRRKLSNRNDCDGVTASSSPLLPDTIAIELIERADKARRRAAARESNGSSPDNPGRH